jgi:hypothetical protein
LGTARHARLDFLPEAVKPDQKRAMLADKLMSVPMLRLMAPFGSAISLIEPWTSLRFDATSST